MDLIDLQKVKEERQVILESSLVEIYESFFHYLEKEANIREKVRAKQIFIHKTKVNRNCLQNKELIPHFEHWFAFDYVTVIGSRLFDIFIREKKGLLSRAMLDLSGFIMLMYLEPVEIVESGQHKIKYRKILNSGEAIVEGESFLFSQKVERGDLAFLRTLNVGFKEKILGPAIIIHKKYGDEIMSNLKDIRGLGKHECRKYLKENGIDYLRYQNREE